MKNLTLDSIRDGLQGQLDEIEEAIRSLNLKLVEAKSLKRQVNLALKALGHENTDSFATKPAPKKMQVKIAIDQLLADNESQIPQADIEGLVAQKLAAEQGCSAMGLALRVREVLATNEYLVEAGMVNKLSADAC